MVQVICKVWGVGIISIIVLTASNILLTLRLLQSHEMASLSGTPHNFIQNTGFSVSWMDTLRAANQSQYITFLKESLICTGAGLLNVQDIELEDVENQDQGAFRINQLLGRYDNSRQYKISDHIFTGPNYAALTSESPLTLATQASVDRLYWLVQVSRYWGAPMSVTVFTPDVEYSIARAYLMYLIICLPFLGDKVTVHFVYPKDRPPKDIAIIIKDLQNKCDQPLSVLKDLLKLRSRQMLKWREQMPYPQNLLRNVARKNCATDWVFLTDVDIVPIPGMSENLSQFLYSNIARKCERCAFVVPTYEVDEKSSFPRDKRQLLDLAKQNKARPFHQKVFIHNQHATNFSRWEARSEEMPLEREVAISHPVTNFEFFYEPFYVARDDVPPHDERFVGYGFTRNTQVYEMLVAGYTFYVLSPIFTLHWGLQSKKGRPAWREKQNNMNRRRFTSFKREVFARYQKDPLNMLTPKKKRT